MKFAQHKGFPNWIYSLGLLALILAVILVVPDWLDYIRKLVLYERRTILAKAEVDFTGQGDRATVIKVKTFETLAIEVYFFDQPGKTPSEVKRIVLNEKRDGFFDYRGEATNLAIVDVDHDSILDLIVPTYDENLIPRLNVYKYSPQDRSFTRLGPESFTLDANN